VCRRAGGRRRSGFQRRVRTTAAAHGCCCERRASVPGERTRAQGVRGRLQRPRAQLAVHARLLVHAGHQPRVAAVCRALRKPHVRPAGAGDDDGRASEAAGGGVAKIAVRERND